MSTRLPLKVSGLIQSGKIASPDSSNSVEPFGGLPRLRDSTPLAPPNSVQKISIELIDDSPYQPRIQYDHGELENLAHTLAAAGLEEPISVRPKLDGRFELISGHRRVRAAKNLGWLEINGIVKNLDDREAKLSTMLRNEARVDLSDYERGKLYAEAVASKFANTQLEIANLFGTTQSLVSKRLAMLSLPKNIIGMLENKPDAFGVTCSSTISQLLKDYPNESELIQTGVERIVKNGADQKSIKGWVEQMIKQKTVNESRDDRSMVISPTGKQIFTSRVVGKDIVVRVNTKNLDTKEIQSKILDLLKSLANEE